MKSYDGLVNCFQNQDTGIELKYTMVCVIHKNRKFETKEDDKELHKYVFA